MWALSNGRRKGYWVKKSSQYEIKWSKKEEKVFFFLLCAVNSCYSVNRLNISFTNYIILSSNAWRSSFFFLIILLFFVLFGCEREEKIKTRKIFPVSFFFPFCFFSTEPHLKFTSFWMERRNFGCLSIELELLMVP